MQKVLLIGPNFHYFNDCLKRAFETVGWDVLSVTYDNPIHPYNFYNKIKYKLLFDKNKLKQKSKTDYKSFIEEKYKTFSPDLVFIMNGDNLLPETITFFKQQSKVAIWLFDSIVRMPSVTDNIFYADYIFCYEKEDIPIIKKKYSIDAYFLPQAADPSLYFKIDNCKKDLDIVFAGDIYFSQKRQHYLNILINNFPNKKIKIWGIYKPWYKGLFKCLLRERRDIYTNCNTTYNVLNEYYNRAKVVINIHNEQQKNGANPKMYEISLSGTYQICDKNPYIASLFNNDEVGLYDNDEQFIRIINEALASNDICQKGENARNKILKEHTFVERVKTILDTIK